MAWVLMFYLTQSLILLYSPEHIDSSLSLKGVIGNIFFDFCLRACTSLLAECSEGGIKGVFSYRPVVAAGIIQLRDPPFILKFESAHIRC